MHGIRHWAGTFVGLALAMGAVASACAQEFPSRALRILVPFAPGSGTDSQARLIATEMSALARQPVLVDNRPGASGMIAAEAAAKSPPDGYTLFYATNTTQAANPSLFRKLPYDPAQDFEPVALIGRGPLVLVVAPESRFTSVAALVSHIRAQPGTVRYASGNGSSRVAAEMLMQQAQLQAVHVPYKSVPQGLTDLIGGQFEFMFPDTIAALPLIRSGKLRPLGVASLKRISSLPDVPTLAEQGYPALELEAWGAMYVPAGTPPAAIRRLNELVVAAAQSKAFTDFSRANALEVTPSTPEQLRVHDSRERQKWAAVIKAAGIEPE